MVISGCQSVCCVTDVWVNEPEVTDKTEAASLAKGLFILHLYSLSVGHETNFKPETMNKPED